VQPGKFPLDRLSWSQFFSSRSEGELVREVEVESWINRDLPTFADSWRKNYALFRTWAPEQALGRMIMP